MALEQREELVNVGHRAPLSVNGHGIGSRFVNRGFSRFQRQRRILGHDKMLQKLVPGGGVGVVRGIHLQERIALMIKELNALALAAGGRFLNVEHAGPLI